MEYDLSGDAADNRGVTLRWDTIWNNKGAANAPPSRTGGVFHCLGGKELIIMGGRNWNNGSAPGDFPALHHVWRVDVETHEWTHQTLEPPPDARSEIFLYTVEHDNKLVVMPSMGAGMMEWDGGEELRMLCDSMPNHFGSPTTIGQTANGLLLQAGDHTFSFSFETRSWTQEDVEKLSDIPYGAHEQNWASITDDLLLMMPKEFDTAFLYLYHIKERKWARIASPPNQKLSGLSGGRCHVLDNYAVWINAPSWEAHVFQAWVFDLLKPADGWVFKEIEGEGPYHGTCCQQTALQADGSVYFTGIGKTEEEYQMARLRISLDGTAPAGWQQELERLYLAYVEPMVTPPPIVHEFVSDEAIIVDPSLEPEKLEYHWKMATSSNLLFAGSEPFDASSIVHSTLPEEPTAIHKNLMHYLTLCWGSHYGVQLTPDMLWYTVLAELADAVSKDPATYRHLFTHQSDKPKLVVPTTDPAHLDFDAIIREIERVSPVDPALFQAQFTTTNAASRLACSAAFLELMGNYYTYGNTCCGIKKVRVLGSKQDWQQLEQQCASLADFFGPASADLAKYLTKAASGVRDVYTRRDPEHWQKFFAINRCHSGHTDVVEGWVVKFFRKGYYNEWRGRGNWQGTDFYNYESHISSVSWTNEETQAKFRLLTGLLHSELDEEEFLVPHFAHIVQRTDGSISNEAYEEYVGKLSEEDKRFIAWIRPWLDNEQVLLSDGKAKLTLRAWRARLEKERADATLRPLALEDDVWLEPFSTWHKPAPEDLQELNTILTELMGLNVWSDIEVLMRELPLCWDRLPLCSKAVSFRTTTHVPDSILVDFIAAAPSLSSLTISPEKDTPWSAELVAALSSRTWDKLGIGARWRKEDKAVQSLLEVLKASPPRKLDFPGESPEIWAFLAENPDSTAFQGAVDLTDPLQAQYVAQSSAFTDISCWSFSSEPFEAKESYPNIKTVTIRSGAVTDLSVLKKFPNLETLGVCADPAVLQQALEGAKLPSLRRVELWKNKNPDHNHAAAPAFIAALSELQSVEELAIDAQYLWKQDALDMLSCWLADPKCTIKSLRVSANQGFQEWGSFFTAVASSPSLESLVVSQQGPVLSFDQLMAIINGAPSLKSLSYYGGYGERRPEPGEQQKQIKAALSARSVELQLNAPFFI